MHSKGVRELQEKAAALQTQMLGVPERKQMKMVKAWLQSLPPDQHVLAQQLLAMGRDTMKPKTKQSTLGALPGGWLTLAAAVLITAIFVVVIVLPHPTTFQMWVFRIMMALAAGSVVAALGGLIKVQGKVKGFAIQAGGAAATFVVVYLINPPALVEQKAEASPAPREPAVEPSATPKPEKAPE